MMNLLRHNLLSQLINVIFFLGLWMVCAPAWANNTLQIEVTGVTGDLLTNVDARLALERKTLSHPLTTKEIRYFYAHANESIKKSLEPYGHFKSVVKSRLSYQDNRWTAHFDVNPGASTKISQVDVRVIGDGGKDPNILTYLHGQPLKVGSPFNTMTYEHTKKELLQAANDSGYIDAVYVEKAIRIDLKSEKASIVLVLDTGPKYFFGPTMFEDSPFNYRFMKRMVMFSEHETFSRKKIVEIQQALEKSYYFQQVEIKPDLQHKVHQHIPLIVSVITPKAKKFNAGIGYGTLTGPRFTAGTEFRRVFDTGQYFTAQLRLSHVMNGLAGKYFIPGHHPLMDQYVIGASYQKFMPKKWN